MWREVALAFSAINVRLQQMSQFHLEITWRSKKEPISVVKMVPLGNDSFMCQLILDKYSNIA